MNQTVHNSRRCPDCDEYGTITEFHTGTSAIGCQHRVRSREMECEQCGTEWVNYE